MRAKMFSKSHEWLTKYFGFEAMRIPERASAWSAALLEGNAYSCSLESVKEGKAEGRYISIISSFFVPLLYDVYCKKGSSNPGNTNPGRFFSSVSEQLLCFCLVAAENLILQWTNGIAEPKMCFGDKAKATSKYNWSTPL